MSSTYSKDAPGREQIDALEGPAVLDFGTDWCGFCRAAQPLIDQALEQQPQVRHVKVEDGKGRRLGRSFGVKLWPTLIFLRDGREVARLVRPNDTESISRAVAAIAGP